MIQLIDLRKTTVTTVLLLIRYRIGLSTLSTTENTLIFHAQLELTQRVLSQLIGTQLLLSELELYPHLNT